MIDYNNIIIANNDPAHDYDKNINNYNNKTDHNKANASNANPNNTEPSSETNDEIPSNLIL